MPVHVKAAAGVRWAVVEALRLVVGEEPQEVEARGTRAGEAAQQQSVPAVASDVLPSDS